MKGVKRSPSFEAFTPCLARVGMWTVDQFFWDWPLIPGIPRCCDHWKKKAGVFLAEGRKAVWAVFGLGKTFMRTANKREIKCQVTDTTGQSWQFTCVSAKHMSWGIPQGLNSVRWEGGKDWSRVLGTQMGSRHELKSVPCLWGTLQCNLDQYTHQNKMEKLKITMKEIHKQGQMNIGYIYHSKTSIDHNLA